MKWLLRPWPSVTDWTNLSFLAPFDPLFGFDKPPRVCQQTRDHGACGKLPLRLRLRLAPPTLRPLP